MSGWASLPPTWWFAALDLLDPFPWVHHNHTVTTGGSRSIMGSRTNTVPSRSPIPQEPRCPQAP